MSPRPSRRGTRAIRRPNGIVMSLVNAGELTSDPTARYRQAFAIAEALHREGKLDTFGEAVIEVLRQDFAEIDTAKP